MTRTTKKAGSKPTRMDAPVESFDDEGVRTGVYCLASPVFDAAGRVAAGVGVCLNKLMCSAAELKRQRERVIDTARALSSRLGGDWAAHVGQPAAAREAESIR